LDEMQILGGFVQGKNDFFLGSCRYRVVELCKAAFNFSYSKNRVAATALNQVVAAVEWRKKWLPMGERTEKERERESVKERRGRGTKRGKEKV